MAFFTKMFGLLSPALASTAKMEKRHKKNRQERGAEIVDMFTESAFREKYFEARRVLEKGGLTDLQKNRFLKRAIFFRDVSRGVISLDSKEEKMFVQEDKRLKKLIEEENYEEA